MKHLWLLFLLLSAGLARAAVTCFKTVSQAAVQVGEQEGGGYQLDFTRRDAFSGKTWAWIRSCPHPEWPPVMVAVEAQQPVVVASDPAAVGSTHPPLTTRPAAPPPLDVVAGKYVKVVQIQGFARIEQPGVVQGSGRIGERVLVRIVPVNPGTQERIVPALIRAADLLEVTQ
jgi:hypothetical protein